ncbi:MAG: VWA domain-containing protein [Proteobacteria bacterium]|nr:VWA domain-containing protein [Pseudomonadota bacterium]
MIHFAWPWLFAMLPLPWLLRLALPPTAPGAALYLPHELALSATLQARGAARRWRLWVAAFAWLLLVTAAARPQRVAPPESLHRSGRALMLAVDVSGSMSIQDMPLGAQTVSRFAAVKAIAGDFISRREGDEVGLVLFGTHAYLLTPLTFDTTTVAKQLEGAAIGLAGRETALGDAIVLATRHLSKLPAHPRVLVLLTDGVNTAGAVAPMDAAQLAASAGVRIYTIGIGSADSQTLSVFGMNLPAPDDDLDVATLGAIARATGGKFFRASDAGQLASAYRSIDALEPLAKGQSLLRPREELYPWPLGLALLIALSLLPWPVPRSRARVVA